MHLPYALVVTTLLSLSWALVFPEAVTFQKRQSIQPGTPLYECHANCGMSLTTHLGLILSISTSELIPFTGGVIAISRSPNYCSNSTFISELHACLECALTYNIWQYYGGDVTTAAKNCGDDATPSPSSAVSTAASTATSASPGSSTGGAFAKPTSSASNATSTNASSASDTPAGTAGTASSTAKAQPTTAAAFSSGNCVGWPMSIIIPTLAVFIQLFH
ncbi:Uncharacterized protein T310_1106 [Rasamsonia emersonii CBS 393.64]|uniref:GPI anchored protein n=1 Tax=Rasamsonia emersonii (strain ATCC 16479 / CBS 393.64 / IMI 116815) TaxID=1408163 RepID=A0A0F4Z4P0_RASE3|nr:Uncharacterized protein T310_1106 [Rasamsonia emersonii CBS 393.64]KKA24838.1 Uncharacterized protein T310_1106 [Rasamsonia emersonii CBS 393.64]